MLDGLGDSSKNHGTINEIATVISTANVATDFDDKYKDDRAYHYNRGIFESKEEAIKNYMKAQANELEELLKELQRAIKSPTNRKTSCANALTIIGRLSHMRQDYYAHGINPRWFTVGSISGEPWRPTATPSSWGGIFWGGGSTEE